MHSGQLTGKKQQRAARCLARGAARSRPDELESRNGDAEPAQLERALQPHTQKPRSDMCSPPLDHQPGELGVESNVNPTFQARILSSDALRWTVELLDLLVRRNTSPAPN
jgi:hypothetical protein